RGGGRSLGIWKHEGKIFESPKQDWAARLAEKRIRWNFKTAIPQYYPRFNSKPCCRVSLGSASWCLATCSRYRFLSRGRRSMDDDFMIGTNNHEAAVSFLLRASFVSSCLRGCISSWPSTSGS